MTLSEIDRRLIEEVHGVLSLPDPLEWNVNVIRRINDLSDHTLIGALERGRKLDFGVRIKEIKLTQESLDRAGLHLHIRSAKKYIELATHKSYCEEASGYCDQRRYGTREGEQLVVDKIRGLFQEGNSFRSIARILNQKGIFPVKVSGTIPQSGLS